MSRIQAMARFRIHPGKLLEFKRLSENCMRLARERDTGTLRYDIFFNADQTECVVYEEYVDSAAHMKHFENMGDNAAAIFQIVDMEGDIWGDPDPKLRAAAEAYGVKVYTPFLRLAD